jgi:hypothetical protein
MPRFAAALLFPPCVPAHAPRAASSAIGPHTAAAGSGAGWWQQQQQADASAAADTPGWDGLPADVRGTILSHLTPKDLARAASTCAEFRQRAAALRAHVRVSGGAWCGACVLPAAPIPRPRDQRSAHSAVCVRARLPVCACACACACVRPPRAQVKHLVLLPDLGYNCLCGMVGSHTNASVMDFSRFERRIAELDPDTLLPQVCRKGWWWQGGEGCGGGVVLEHVPLLPALCCIMLCRAVLCCAVLCCAVAPAQPPANQPPPLFSPAACVSHQRPSGGGDAQGRGGGSPVSWAGCGRGRRAQLGAQRCCQRHRAAGARGRH